MGGRETHGWVGGEGRGDPRGYLKQQAKYNGEKLAAIHLKVEKSE